MALKPDDSQPGLWLPERAAPAKNGVHALIIGVSAYPFLDGGDGQPRPASTGGMGQLVLCARTAAKIFAWLARQEAILDAPVASCRLLLAPSEAEETIVADLTGGHFAPATMASIRETVLGWGDALVVGARSSGRNVAFLFFSGHGLEHLASPALLASDILDPMAANGHNHALAVARLREAVSTFGVDAALFGLDACRNASELARRLHIVGQDLLEPRPYPERLPEAVLTVQATRAGQFAYQMPGDEATIFGQSLLEGLEGVPPDYAPYDTSDEPWRLLFMDLERHVKTRSIELIGEHSATRLQMAEVAGTPYVGEAVIARMPPMGRLARDEGARAAPAAPAEPAAEDPELPGVDPGRRHRLAGVSSRILGRFREVTGAMIAQGRALRRADGGPAAEPAGGLLEPGLMHEVLGHEWATEAWFEGVEILDLDSGAPLADDVVTLVNGRTDDAGGNLTAWVDLHIAPGAGQAIWIKCRAAGGESALATAIPRDRDFPIPVRLEIGIADAGAGPGVVTLSTRLGPANGLPDAVAPLWRALWDAQRLELLVDLAHAGKLADERRVLESALEGPGRSPVAAAVSAALLLRAGGRLARLGDGPRALDECFPWLAEGAVLRAASLLRRLAVELGLPAAAEGGFAADPERLRAAADHPLMVEAARAFAGLDRRGPPLLREVLAMAGRMVPAWRRLIDGERVAASVRDSLDGACLRVEEALEPAIAEGVFLTFQGDPDHLMPAHLIGPRPACTEPAPG